jgi:alpha-tubulin suppressor-like RCC1 family protein
MREAIMTRYAMPSGSRGKWWWSLAVTMVLCMSQLMGCSGAPEAELVPGACVPGRAEACPCPGGLVGAQVCLSDGTFSGCDCSPPVIPDAGFDDDVFAPVDTGPSDAGPSDTGAPDDVGSPPDTEPVEDVVTTPDTPGWDGSVEDVDPVAPGENGCGGDTPLAIQPGSPCGQCRDGQWICDGTEALRCVGARTPNVCGSCGPLKHAVGDLCGPCGQGRWACGGDGQLVCEGDTALNACGGCAVLPAERWWDCELAPGDWGYWECSSPNTLLCISYDANNPCGGLESLDNFPGERCGPCGGGTVVCTGPNTVVCNEPARGQNPCGGCAELVGSPGEACGECDGQWACDGLNRLRCSEPLNLCGACDPLPALPGDGCGQDGIVTCRGLDDIACLNATQFNACGGTEPLEAMPGAACGECGDGFYICASREKVVCIEARQQRNVCGGCVDLWAELNQLCSDEFTWGEQLYWQCDEDGDGIFCDAIEDNGCGGNRPLAYKPGESCRICGIAECTSNPNQVDCTGGTFSLDYDPRNCGACGQSCAPDEYCHEGRCAVDTIIDLDAGADFTCALGQSGRVWCWGSGNLGRLGQSRPASQWTWTHHRQPVVVEGLIDAVEIVLGRSGACAVRATGDVVCWGDNAFGSLGVDQTGAIATPVEVPALKTIRGISGGNGLFCGINEARRAVCWGANRYGELGRGETSTGSNPPGEVLNLENVVQVVAGRETSGNPPFRHACALLENGSVWCWGSGASGRLGNGSTAGSTVPVRVTGIEDAVHIGVAKASTCAVLANGEVWCWGSNALGLLGFGQSTPSSSSIPVKASISDARQIVGTHGIYHQCAVTNQDELWCWGFNEYGLHGRLNENRSYLPAPTEFYGRDRLRAVASGEHHMCALDKDGRVFCSGRGANAQIRFLGDNQLNSAAVDRWQPVQVVNLGDAPGEAGLCRDGRDNNGNRLVDCADPACATDLGAAAPVFLTDIMTGSEGNYFEGSCGVSNGRERVYTWTAPATGRFLFSVEGSHLQTVLYVLETCRQDAPDAELACDAGSGIDGRSQLVLDVVRGQPYVIVVDSAASVTSLLSFALQITPTL